MAIHQIFVRLLDGKTQCLQVPSPTVSGETLKRVLFSRTNIPLRFQRLVSGAREISDETLIYASEDGIFPSCNLLLRLRGGKGGFGSLLRGAATKAGQKKTNNFDACRDMSGRRLRHVNAEKKLEEWKAEADERRLEKIAEQFLKKKAKEARKSSSVAVEKYIEKYKEDSEKCMEEVEESVRQSFGLYEKSKRKILPSSGPASKRLKIWFGKKKVEGIDSEDDEDSDDEDGADERSVVLDDVNHKVDDGSSGSVSRGHSDGESSGGGSAESNLEEEIGPCNQGCLESEKASGCEDVSADSDSSEKAVCVERSVRRTIVSSVEKTLDSGDVNSAMVGSVEPRLVLHEQMDAQSTLFSCPEKPMDSSEVNLSVEETFGPKLVNQEQIKAQGTMISCPEKSLDSNEVMSTGERAVEPELVIPEEVAANSEEPLNFDKFNSAAEMEVLGMERLKIELQERGLKCGGTLQERAARLFLLKTTPIEKLPKKLLAKALGGGGK